MRVNHLKVWGVVMWVAVGSIAYADEPMPAKRVAAVKMVIGAMLRDASSAKYQNLFIGRDNTSCGEVNSKTAFGGYAGFVRFVISQDAAAIEVKEVTSDNAQQLLDFNKGWYEHCAPVGEESPEQAIAKIRAERAARAACVAAGNCN
jgi:hypothetical protein